MDFKTRYPDYAAIETLVKRARVERSLFIGEAIANALVAGTCRRQSGRLVRHSRPSRWPARDALAKGWVPAGLDPRRPDAAACAAARAAPS